MANLTLDQVVKQYYTDETLKPKTKPSIVCLGCNIPICSVCGVCHSPGCAYREERVTEISQQQKYRYLSARTQKARGFVNLQHRAQLKTPTPYYLILEESDIEPAVHDAFAKGMVVIFVRPCPVRARHGFEESRPVEWTADGGVDGMIADVKAIWKAANLADEEHAAELILLPYIKAKVNSILTPTRAAVGPNHDGATAGYESISIPLAGVPFQEMKESSLGELSGLGPDDDPYFEVVACHLMEPLFTQLRAGVRLSSADGADYVPAPMRVKEVIDAAGDLLEWEAQVKTLKPGTVVVKLGGTLISHYGVHCLYNKVACFTTRRPAIGELLNPIGVAPKPSPEAVIEGLGFGALVELDLQDNGRYSPEAIHIKAALISMMTVLHNSTVMSGDNGFWLGVSVSLMMRAGMAASHGEARHKLQDLQNMRSYVYRLAFKDFMGSRNTLGTAQWMFQNLAWSPSYGGPAWSKCTDSLIKMDDQVRQLLNEPTEANVAHLVSALNVAVNQAHNGGWWLNKFIEQSWFDWASKQSLRSVAIAVHTMFYFSKLKPKYNTKDLLLDWRTSPAIMVNPNGKLLVQVKAPKIDQTVFSDKVKKSTIKADNKTITDTLWYKASIPEALEASIDAHHEQSGAYCAKCGKFWEDTVNGANLSSPLVCGKNNCTGNVGNWDGETFLYYHYEVGSGELTDTDNGEDDDNDDEPADDDYDSEADSWDSDPEPDPELTEPAEPPVEVVVPSGAYYNPQVDSIPSIKAGGKGIKGINMNGSSSKGHVTIAQVNFTKPGNEYAAHVQFRTSDMGMMSSYYFSTDVAGIKVSPETAAKIQAGQLMPLLTWSGSGVFNYWPLLVTIKGDIASLDQDTLGLHFELTLNPVKLTLKGVSNDGQKQVDEIKTEAEAFDANDVPF